MQQASRVVMSRYSLLFTEARLVLDSTFNFDQSSTQTSRVQTLSACLACLSPPAHALSFLLRPPVRVRQQWISKSHPCLSPILCNRGVLEARVRHSDCCCLPYHQPASVFQHHQLEFPAQSQKRLTQTNNVPFNCTTRFWTNPPAYYLPSQQKPESFRVSRQHTLRPTPR